MNWWQWIKIVTFLLLAVTFCGGLLWEMFARDNERRAAKVKNEDPSTTLAS